MRSAVKLELVSVLPTSFIYDRAITPALEIKVCMKRLAWVFVCLLFSTLVCCQPTDFVLLFLYKFSHFTPPPQVFQDSPSGSVVTANAKVVASVPGIGGVIGYRL